MINNNKISNAEAATPLTNDPAQPFDIREFQRVETRNCAFADRLSRAFFSHSIQTSCSFEKFADGAYDFVLYVRCDRATLRRFAFEALVEEFKVKWGASVIDLDDPLTYAAWIEFREVHDRRRQWTD